MIPHGEESRSSRSGVPDSIPSHIVSAYGSEAREQVEWSRLSAMLEAQRSTWHRASTGIWSLTKPWATLLLVIITVAGIAAMILPVAFGAPFAMVMAGALVSVMAALVDVSLIQTMGQRRAKGSPAGAK